MNDLQIEQFLKGRVLHRVDIERCQITLTFVTDSGLPRREDKLVIEVVGPDTDVDVYGYKYPSHNLEARVL